MRNERPVDIGQHQLDRTHPPIYDKAEELKMQCWSKGVLAQFEFVF
jgi:hypothetical protein